MKKNKIKNVRILAPSKEDAKKYIELIKKHVK